MLLIAIDWLIAATESLPASYVLYFGGAALVLPVLAFLPNLPSRLGRFYPILILSLMSLITFFGVTFVLPSSGMPSWIAVRTSPVVYIRQWVPDFMVLTLIAYGYRWIYVALYGITMTTLYMVLATIRLSPEFLQGFYILSLFAGASSLILGLAISRMFQHLHRQQAALRDANVQIMELASVTEELAVSRERIRMARELHDTLAHSLAGLIIQLETVDGYWDKDPGMAHDLLQQTLETARSGLQETRRALSALRASPLEDMGLVLALKQLSEAAVERVALQLSLQLPRQLPELSDETEQCIYRVAQEAISNVQNHAHAGHLDLWLTQVNGRITLNVHDDGIGFDPAKVSHPGHYGVPGMKERARLAGGELKITSSQNQGTTVTLDLPIIKR